MHVRKNGIKNVKLLKILKKLEEKAMLKSKFFWLRHALKNAKFDVNLAIVYI